MKRRDLLLAMGAGALGGCSLFEPPPQLDFSLPSPTRVALDTRKRGDTLRATAFGLSAPAALWRRAPSPDQLALLRPVAGGGMLSADVTPDVAASALAPLLALCDGLDSRLLARAPLAPADAVVALAKRLSAVFGNRLYALELTPGEDDSARWQATRHTLEHRVLLGAPGALLTRAPSQCGDWIAAHQPSLLSVQLRGAPPEAARRRRFAGAGFAQRYALPETQAQALDALQNASMDATPRWISRVGADGAGSMAAALWTLHTALKACSSGHWQGACLDGLHLASDDAGALYYALRLLRLMLPGTPVDSRVIVTPPPGTPANAPRPVSPLHAHAVIDNGNTLKLVLINLDANSSIDVEVDADRTFSGGTVLRLTSPTIDSDGAATLGSATVDARGRWQASYTETVQCVKGTAYLTVNAGSAALVTLA